jgi:hypothetical protein
VSHAYLGTRAFFCGKTAGQRKRDFGAGPGIDKEELKKIPHQLKRQSGTEPMADSAQKKHKAFPSTQGKRGSGVKLLT